MLNILPMTLKEIIRFAKKEGFAIEITPKSTRIELKVTDKKTKEWQSSLIYLDEQGSQDIIHIIKTLIQNLSNIVWAQKVR